MLSPKKLLVNARNRIAKRENWGQGTLARDARGNPVPPLSPTAVQWCMLGALGAEAGYGDACGDDRAYGSGYVAPEYREALAALREASPTGGVFTYNDAVGHEDVLDLFDTAIANMKGE